MIFTIICWMTPLTIYDWDILFFLFPAFTILYAQLPCVIHILYEPFLLLLRVLFLALLHASPIYLLPPQCPDAYTLRCTVDFRLPISSGILSLLFLLALRRGVWGKRRALAIGPPLLSVFLNSSVFVGFSLRPFLAVHEYEYESPINLSS